MKKLQNDFTTPEQSKILLELGVPADSADCYFYTKVDKQPKILTTDKFDWLESPYIPCWSAGRLIEIFELCTGTLYNRHEERNTLEDVVLMIRHAHFLECIDFSKLEE